MNISQRWLLATIVTVVVLVIARLESKDMLNSNIRAIVSSSEDVVFLQKAVKTALGREEKKIAVSSSVHSQKLLEFVNAKPFDDGYLLTYEEAPTLEAFQDGYIVFTGHKKNTGKTMTVHYGDIVVTYGKLDAFNRLPYTSVVKGDLLAMKGLDSPLFLKIEEDGQALHLEQILSLLQEWHIE